MIAVLGSTGNNGREVVKALRARNAPVRAIARDVEKAADLRALGADVVAGDLENVETLASAFSGATALFLLAPVAPHQADLELNALRIARAAGVGRVIKLSAIGADPLAAGHFSRSHGIVESALKASGLGFTIVRGAFFYSNVLFAAEQIKQGQYYGHWEDRAAAWVDPVDLAGVCAACLLDAATAGQTLVATGPEAMTNVQVCEKLSAGLDKKVTYVDVSPAAYGATLLQHGAPQWYADAEVALRDVVFSGEAALVTNVVPRLLGRAATSLEAYTRANAAALR